jgi:hypothetical protein
MTKTFSRKGFFVRGMRIPVLFLIAVFFSCLPVWAQEKPAETSQIPKERAGLKLLPEEEITERIVRIEPYRTIELHPKNLVGGRGTVVIWLNRSHSPLHITFRGGDQVKIACAEPKHFVLQPDGNFQSDEIPFGGTASLCFIEKGEYKYDVIGTAVGGYSYERKKIGHGTILIK